MIDWVKANPGEVDKVLNSPFRPEALDQLDNEFFDENKKHPVNAWSKTWVEQLPNLKIIPERAFLDRWKIRVLDPVERSCDALNSTAVRPSTTH